MKTNGKGLLDKMVKHKIVMDPKSYRMAHPVYSKKEAEKVGYTHIPPEGIGAKLVRAMVAACRAGCDIATKYNEKDLSNMDERAWMNRVIFLETIAGVPGMIAGMQRHLRSLRTLERDHGWIHHLL